MEFFSQCYSSPLKPFLADSEYKIGEFQSHLLLSAGSVHLEKSWIHVQFQHFFFPGSLGVGVSTEGAEQLSTSTETGNVVGTEGEDKNHQYGIFLKLRNRLQLTKGFE